MKQEWPEQCCLPWGYRRTAARVSVAASSFPKCYGWIRSLTLTSVLDVYFRIDGLVLPGLLWTVAMPGSLGTAEQLRKLGLESSPISLEELWSRVTVWNYLQQQEIQNRMRRERQAVASCWTINSFAFPKPKVGEAERERSIWLEAVGRADRKEGLSVIYQTLTEKCKWRVSPAVTKANSFLRIHVLHVKEGRGDIPSDQ